MRPGHLHDLDTDSRDSFIKELQMRRHSTGQTTWPRHERLGPFQSLYTAAAAATNWVVNCNQWMEPIQSDIFVCKGDLLIQILSVSHQSFYFMEQVLLAPKTEWARQFESTFRFIDKLQLDIATGMGSGIYHNLENVNEKYVCPIVF